MVATCDSKRVFSSLSRIWCMLCSSPFLSFATNESPPVVCAMRFSSSGFTGKCSRTKRGCPKMSVPSCTSTSSPLPICTV